MGTSFYIHVRDHARAVAFAVIGPYQTREAAEQAARFANLRNWVIEQRNHHGSLELF